MNPNAIGWDEAEAALCKRSFRRFIRRAWDEIDPNPFIENWHVDAIADHLQAVHEGQLQRLIINVPPGAAKSMITSVLWPAWVWANRPDWQVLCASYEVGLATRDAVKCRDLMRTPWYTQWFRNDDSPIITEGWDFADSQDVKQYYKNTKQGHRAALGVGGRATGYRGDSLIIDDPISVKDAYSTAKLDACIRWKDTTMASRFNDKAKASEVLIMQRVHERDLTGHLLSQGGWEHLCIPARYTPKRYKGTALPWVDSREVEGESFFKAYFTEPVLERLKHELGSYAFAGQYQQTPAPAEGGIIKRHWFNRRWLMPDEKALDGVSCRPLPMDFEQIAFFTDAAFKKTEDSDRVAIAVVGVKGPDIYLLALAWERMSFVETAQRLVDLRARWSMCTGIYIEEAANGAAIIDSLKVKLPGLIPIQPQGSKEARIGAASPYMEAGNLWLPLSSPWVEDFINEACSFPKAAHDDAIDAVCYSLLTFCNKPMTLMRALMAEDH
jgi:predicted phage terminase large subunit-like protein